MQWDEKTTHDADSIQQRVMILADTHSDLMSEIWKTYYKIDKDFEKGLAVLNKYEKEHNNPNEQEMKEYLANRGR